MPVQEPQRLFWKRHITLKLQLSQQEVATISEIKPLAYVSVPQTTYLPCLAQAGWKQFQSLLPMGSKQELAWFEFNGLKLRWEYPVGVLFDLFPEAPQPWVLTIHFRDYPEELKVWGGALNVKTNFYNSLKEACFIFTGSAGRVLRLVEEEKKELWESIEKGVVDQFSKRISVMGLNPTARPGRECVEIPVRILVRRNHTQGLVHVWGNVWVTSRPVKSQIGDQYVTLKSVLQDILSEENLEEAKVLIGGIEPNLELPLAWLHANLCSQDYFLYVVVHCGVVVMDL
eukprot:TRINITY_DN11620_c0_g2_i1.p1 TRINITY_DN11620_c0_g2~~TRINITY_DN11620_c0_g2_i1.p1  ORF type:complete len:286 (-),score=47.97 TRINITY_DN11620_c0_g2_i1:166-1023(-)